jgi:23S rRNA (cytosine1962-C5)-methyltransferase
MIQTLLPRLFEDELFLAVEKPAGLDVGGQEGQTGIIEILAGMRGKREKFFVVNRLSRYESGVLLLGKTAEAADFVRSGLRAQRVDQEFVAVVIGRMKERRMVVEAGSKGVRTKPETKLAPAPRRGDRSRRVVPKAGTRPIVRGDGENITTLLQIEQGERRTLLRCHTSASNTHELRAQLRSVRLRLVGDNVHDPSPKRQLNEATCLHLAKLTFHHPGLRTRVGVTSPAPDFSAALGGGFDVERVLRAALARRLPILIDKQTDSLRLITGPLEGLRGINAEIFGNVVILYVLDEKSDDRNLLARIGKWYNSALDAKSVYAKPFVKDRIGAAEKNAERLRSPKPLLGRTASEQIEIRERNLKYLIRPYDGFSVGLFLDHRENRARIHDAAKGADVLNLFAYTCGFSAAAAVGGAKSTTSVDVSVKNLEWGKANFALNHVELADHTFIRSDAMDYLQRARRQEKAFDLIVIDPPSFAHGRGSKKDFSIANDLPELIAAAVEVLRPGGGMMVSTNFRKLSLRDLKELVRKGSGRRRGKVVDAPSLPLDFAIDRDHAKTIFLQFDGD